MRIKEKHFKHSMKNQEKFVELFLLKQNYNPVMRNDDGRWDEHCEMMNDSRDLSKSFENDFSSKSPLHVHSSLDKSGMNIDANKREAFQAFNEESGEIR